MEKVIEILKDLVKISSSSGQEAELAGYIHHFFEKKGLSSYLQEGNVVTHIQNNSPNCLVFNAHMDTVDAGDLGKWKSSPLTLKPEGNKLYGLGVSDEKVSIAILMEMACELYEMDLSTDVIMAFVKNEEVDGSGSRSFVDHFLKNFHYQNSSCIMCEPTNSLCLELGNKGNYFLEFVAKGKSVHSSQPDLGINAVDVMYQALQKAKGIITGLTEESAYLGKTTIAAPTTITAGQSANKVPDICKATVDIRTIPETHPWIYSLLKKELESESLEVKLKYYPAGPSLTLPSEQIVKVFEKVGITQRRYTPTSNDCVFFTEKGIPSVVFGAGNLECVHQPNEYVEIGNISKTKEIYLKVAQMYGK